MGTAAGGAGAVAAGKVLDALRLAADDRGAAFAHATTKGQENSKTPRRPLSVSTCWMPMARRAPRSMPRRQKRAQANRSLTKPRAWSGPRLAALKKTAGHPPDNIHIQDSASKFQSRWAATLTRWMVSTSTVRWWMDHAHRTDEVWGVLETGTGSRRQPLMFGITTAASTSPRTATSCATTPRGAGWRDRDDGFRHHHYLLDQEDLERPTAG